MSYAPRLMVAALFASVSAACATPSGESTGQASASLGAPGFVGNAVSVISRGCSTPCAADARPLAAGYTYDDWAFSRAVTQVGAFEVYQAGITDWNDPDTWRLLDVRVYSRSSGVADFSFKYVPLLDHVGNNARYAFPLGGAMDPFFDMKTGLRHPIATAADCPKGPYRLGADGASIEVDVELYFTVNGTELRPAPGATFRGTYSTTMLTKGVCTGATPTLTEQTGGDVTVLRAKLGATVASSAVPSYVGGLRFDPAKCTGDDCTAPIQALLALPGDAFESPMLDVFHYTNPTSAMCETLELESVTRADSASAPTFAGIGFFYANHTVYTSPAVGFVAKGLLDVVARVTLKDGSAGIVHRFVAPGMCFGQGGNSSGIYSRSYELKPYARYDVATTRAQYRVWDAVSSNYLLGRAKDGGFVTSFDRSGELLAP